MNILQVCSFAAEYEGNFIKSLYALEEELKKLGHNVYYAFADKAGQRAWCRKLEKKTKVFFLPMNNSRINTKACSILKSIISSEKIDIIHSHFEAYDLACKMAAKKETKVFWHLHDPIVKARRPQKNLIVKLQYSFFGKNVKLISVCDYYKDIAVSLGFNPESAVTVLNGIDLNRITYPYSVKDPEYDFMTFGWDFHRKGVDIILKALSRLSSQGYGFKFLLNCNEQAVPKIKDFFGGETPDWLTIGGHTEDINSLFGNAKVFIQASRRETFCYAACEAAYAGLEVLSSDIAGLKWAHNVPSVTFFESENDDRLYYLLKQRLDNKKHFPDSVVDASRKIIEKNYSVENWVKQIVGVYGLGE